MSQAPVANAEQSAPAPALSVHQTQQEDIAMNDPHSLDGSVAKKRKLFATAGPSKTLQLAENHAWLKQIVDRVVNYYHTSLKRHAQLSSAIERLNNVPPQEHPLLKLTYTPMLLQDKSFAPILTELNKDLCSSLKGYLIDHKSEKLRDVAMVCSIDHMVHYFGLQVTDALLGTALTSQDKATLNSIIHDEAVKLRKTLANVQLNYKHVDFASGPFEFKKPLKPAAKVTQKITLNTPIANYYAVLASKSECQEGQTRHQDCQTSLENQTTYSWPQTPSKTAKRRHQRRKRQAKRQTETVNNISSIVIPNIISEFLGKGHKYIPHRYIHQEEMQQQWIECKNHILAHCNNVKSHTVSAILAKHEKRLQNNIHKLNHPMINETKLINNTHEWLVNNQLIVKPADKNLGLTIMDSIWYIKQVQQHLSDRKYYKPVLQCDKETLCSSLTRIRQEHYKGGLERVTFNDSAKLPEFYVIPKLHKTPVKTRPIVPSYNYYTTRASQFLHTKLYPIQKTFPWILNNSMSCVQKLNDAFIPANAYLVSFDVESMYTNIDIDEGIHTIQQLTATHVPNSAGLCALLRWVLENNYFTFQGQCYHQIRGIAMGTNCAPTVANLFMAYFEHQLHIQSKLPKHYYRYIDDGFFIWTKSHEELLKFMEEMNTLSPSLRFTWQVSQHTMDFLDLTIYKGKRYHKSSRLDIQLFAKPFNNYLYTDPSSDYPDTYRFSWITGEQIRIIRNCSTLEQYNIALNSFKQHLLIRGYHATVIKHYMHYSYNDRPRFLTPDIPKRKAMYAYGSRLPIQMNDMVIPFYPKHSPGIVQLRQHVSALVKDLHLFNFLPAYVRTNFIIRRGKSLFSFLSKTSMNCPPPMPLQSAVPQDGLNVSSNPSRSLRLTGFKRKAPD